MTKLRSETPQLASDDELIVEPHATAPSPRKSKQVAPERVKRALGLTAAEQQILAELKQACADVGVEVKKSDLLRCALKLLAAQSPDSLMQGWLALAPVKDKKARK